MQVAFLQSSTKSTHVEPFRRVNGLWPIKIVPDMTYNVFSETLNLAQSINPKANEN